METAAASAARTQSVMLTEEQQTAVDHDGRLLLVAGPSGSGRTATLRARYLRLVERFPGSAVVVLCPTRAGAGRFVDGVLPFLAGGLDAVPATTVWGLAADLLARHGRPVTLLGGAEQREEVGRLLAADGPARWPSAPHLLPRRAFVHEVASALLDVQASFMGDDEVLARADDAGQKDRWADLLGFAAHYRAALAERDVVDGAGLLVAACRLLERPDVAAAEAGRVAAVMVDDAEVAHPATGRLVGALGRLGAEVTLAADPSATPSHRDPWLGLSEPGAAHAFLTRVFRRPAPPVLVSCNHPAVEPEAVAGELLAASDEGVPWSEMAVIVRSRGERARAIARALARHGIPTAPPASVSSDEPVVRAVLDVLRWVGGDGGALERLVTSPVASLDPAEARAVRREAMASGIPLEAHPRLGALAELRAGLVARAATATPADLAFEVWQRALGHLVGGEGTGDERALDALVAFLDGLSRRAERRPHERLAHFLARHLDHDPPADPWRAGAALGPETVTITSAAGATGRQWHTVVVAGCVESSFPRVRARPHHFDRALLEEARPPTPAERRQRALADERRLFRVACSRASSRLVATAAPEPGVLLSRFVEGWPRAEVQLPLAPGPLPVVRAGTTNPVPASPDGVLRLSASQLATYDDCPLRYAYEYVLGARGEAGIHAGLGSLVHQVLAAFCDPEADPPVPRTRESLQALAEELWRDDVARYRPQAEEARRDYFAMLDAWWQGEGGTGEQAPEVLAVERYFDVEVGPHRVTGFIDRIDRADDGVGIRIVDYKTGKTEPRADAVADDLQLAVYHLAATRDPELAALGPPTQLRLLYLRSMHALDQPVEPGHEAATEARILAGADRILAEEFEPSVEANCRLCSFHRLCPLQKEGRVTVGEAS
jgi:superfamily I DNA/RNA helicase/RecB family exonuclease